MVYVLGDAKGDKQEYIWIQKGKMAVCNDALFMKGMQRDVKRKVRVQWEDRGKGSEKQ